MSVDIFIKMSEELRAFNCAMGVPWEPHALTSKWSGRVTRSMARDMQARVDELKKGRVLRPYEDNPGASVARQKGAKRIRTK